MCTWSPSSKRVAGVPLRTAKCLGDAPKEGCAGRYVCATAADCSGEPEPVFKLTKKGRHCPALAFDSCRHPLLAPRLDRSNCETRRACGRNHIREQRHLLRRHRHAQAVHGRGDLFPADRITGGERGDAACRSAKHDPEQEKFVMPHRRFTLLRDLVQLLEHLVGRLDYARIRFIRALRKNHVHELFDDVHVRLFEHPLLDRAQSFRTAGSANNRIAGGCGRQVDVVADTVQAAGVGKCRQLNDANLLRLRLARQATRSRFRRCQS